MYSICTVYFEDPYWVGVFERNDDSGYAAARYVFGSEPTEAEIHQFTLRDFQALSYSHSSEAPEMEERQIGYKRRQREVRQAMVTKPVGTYAQRALQADRERVKQVRQKESREEREAREKEKYLLKQAQKKKHHRGR